MLTAKATTVPVLTPTRARLTKTISLHTALVMRDTPAMALLVRAITRSKTICSGTTKQIAVSLIWVGKKLSTPRATLGIGWSALYPATLTKTAAKGNSKYFSVLDAHQIKRSGFFTRVPECR